jgi:NAD(P)-dependent dehydrogenase (short-subunit alcohol dehydrogenase family)
MKDVFRIGKEIRVLASEINILVNNAGLHGFTQRITADGLPEMVAVNYLAPWLLTQELLPNLRNAENARVINVASEASRNHGKLQLPNDLMDTSPFTVKESSVIYGKTKLLDIMFTKELARLLESTNVVVNALCPGFNVTGLGRELSFSSTLTKILNFLHIGRPTRGAEIIIQLAISPKYQSVTGGYFQVGSEKDIEPIYPGNDVNMQSLLWSETEKLIKQKI